MSEPILQFEGARLAAGERYDVTLHELDLVLQPGELALVDPQRRADHMALADAAMGLWEPDTGAIRFDGQAWNRMSPQRAAAQRHRIGRVFDECAWLSNLDIEENILLAARHHTRHPEEELAGRLREICERLELDLPLQARPGRVNRVLLQRGQWVRALLSEPRLLVLEYPTEGIGESESWLREMARQREQGTAMLWLCDDPFVWNHPIAEGAQRFRVNAGRMERMEEARGTAV